MKIWAKDDKKLYQLSVPKNFKIAYQFKKGISVVANKKFLKGDKIIVFRGKILKYDEIMSRSYKDDHCLQIGENIYLGPSGKLDDFINHSCNPNSGIKNINGKLILVAIKDIKNGEEITWDYSTYANEGRWQMDCHCGSKNCRRKIKDFKHLPEKIKKKYIKLRIVPKYILE